MAKQNYFKVKNGLEIPSQQSFQVTTSSLPSVSPSLLLDFTTDALDPRVTFTRASTGTYTDKFGVLKTAAANTPRFDYANTVKIDNKNLVSDTTAFSTWTKTETTVTSASGITDPNGLSPVYQVMELASTNIHSILYVLTSLNIGKEYTLSVHVKTNGRDYVVLTENGSTLTSSYRQGAQFQLSTSSVVVQSLQGNSKPPVITDLGGGWYRCSITFIPTVTQATYEISLGSSLTTAGNQINRPSYLGDITKGLYVWGAQVELGSYVTSYQAISYPTTNTPYTTTAASNGILIEDSRINIILWCRDATQSAWVKTDITATRNQTGIDGVTNSASLLTSTASNGTCVQSMTATSASRSGSIYIKRVSGTGTVQVTFDGTTWSTVDISNGVWNRVVLFGTITNPALGIRLVNSGDSVAIDYAQVEATYFIGATSPILTTSATVTRATDTVKMTGTNFSSWFNPDQSTLCVQGMSIFALTKNVGAVLEINNNTQSNFFNVFNGYGTITSAYTQYNWAYAISNNGTTSSSYRNGSSMTIGAINTNPSNLTQMQIGIGRIYYPMPCLVKRIAYYPKRLTNTELQALTQV